MCEVDDDDFCWWFLGKRGGVERTGSYSQGLPFTMLRLAPAPFALKSRRHWWWSSLRSTLAQRMPRLGAVKSRGVEGECGFEFEEEVMIKITLL